MEIILARTSGFCFGVRNAVEKTKDILEENNDKKIYCLGELVHNRQVMEDLENNGLIVADVLEEIPEYNTVIIRAHGVPKNIYEDAKIKNLKVIDLTCPKVSKIHDIIEEYSNKNYYIGIIGEKNHPETIGNKGFAWEYSFVIENEDDISEFINQIKYSELENVLIVSQTTFSVEKFDKYIEQIKERLNDKFNLEVIKTICDATKIRQQETEELSKTSDLVIIIGGKKSSNTRKLFDIALKNNKNSMQIETKEELNIEAIRRYNRIGIVAGASTPDMIIEEVIERINDNGNS